MFDLIFQEGWLLPLAVGVSLLFAAMIQRLLGFGFGLASLSSLTLAFSRLHSGGNSIQLAILVASVTGLVPLALLVGQFYREIDRTHLIPTLIGTFVGLPVGMVVFEQVSAVALARLAGAMLLILVVDSLRSGAKEAGQASPVRQSGSDDTRTLVAEPHPITAPVLARLSPAWGSFAGVISGVLHGSIGIPGPPIVYYGTRQNWTPNQFRAFVSGAMILVSVLKVGLFTVRGHITQEVAAWSLWSVPCLFLGYYLGAKSADRVPEKQFRAAVLILILMSAIGMLTYRPAADSVDGTAVQGIIDAAVD